MNRFHLTALLFFPFLVAGCLHAQSAESYSLAREVPAAPAERFKDGFPNVADVVWHKVIRGEEIQWESSFSQDQAVYNLRFNEAGTLLWSDKTIDWATVPAATQTAIQQALTEKLGKYTLVLTEERVAARLKEYALTVTTKTPKGTQTHLAILDPSGALKRIEQGQITPHRGKKSRKKP